jgi:hypothetical protein
LGGFDSSSVVSCKNSSEAKKDIDTLTNNVELKVNEALNSEVLDSARSKGGKIFEDVKEKGAELWNSTKSKAANLLKKVKS